ncbi:hypothetical protein TWF696_001836 [Orbilia brochopaga]|uniref:Nudix hydrolase domain-containing protein n=1 Tax=Orbilia brochopaga TaxID=3140254 RepID=A0AAV9U5N6_9PEZI
MKPTALLSSCTCLPSLITKRRHKPSTATPSTTEKPTANPTITMSTSNVVAFAIPVGHLEPAESRPMYHLPPLPNLRSGKTMRNILRIDKRRKEREKRAAVANAGAGHANSGFMNTGGWRDNGGSFGLAAVGERVIEEAVGEILEESAGQKLSFDEKETIKQSFLTENQAQYLAMCYRMEQHIHHYGDWATISTQDLADVFRGYIGALAAENELGVAGVSRWLHKLLEPIIVEQVEYRIWKGECERVVERRGAPAGVTNMTSTWKGKGKENEK